MVKFGVWALIIAGLADAVAVHAQPRTSISGRVVDTASVPVSDIRVWAVQSNGYPPEVTETRTDSLGAFTLHGVPVGDVYLRVDDSLIRSTIPVAGLRDVELTYRRPARYALIAPCLDVCGAPSPVHLHVVKPRSLLGDSTVAGYGRPLARQMAGTWRVETTSSRGQTVSSEVRTLVLSEPPNIGVNWQDGSWAFGPIVPWDFDGRPSFAADLLWVCDLNSRTAEGPEVPTEHPCGPEQVSLDIEFDGPDHFTVRSTADTWTAQFSRVGVAQAN